MVIQADSQHRMERSPLSPLDVLALAPRSPEKAQSDFEAHRESSHGPAVYFYLLLRVLRGAEYQL